MLGMLFIEMSREESHGGGTWAFSNCVWAPTEKKGGGNWPYWNKILEIKKDDIVIHLRGKPPNAYFVGYSIAAADGFATSKRPPIPGKWEYANNFFRADLTDYSSFHKPINLKEIFTSRQNELVNYFNENKNKNKKNIFFVIQSEKLQCLNGAYLSEVDNDLFRILFFSSENYTIPNSLQKSISIETGIQLANIKSRIGQAEFSKQIKILYNHRCCFPGCNVTDPRFLIAAHIARWSDNEELRGNPGNGLCLCLLHDKAFEIGIFTLDDKYRIFINPKELHSDSPVVKSLLPFHGHEINTARYKPLDDALLEHWIRVDIDPV